MDRVVSQLLAEIDGVQARGSCRLAGGGAIALMRLAPWQHPWVEVSCKLARGCHTYGWCTRTGCLARQVHSQLAGSLDMICLNAASRRMSLSPS